jgi:hypothetical protein
LLSLFASLRAKKEEVNKTIIIAVVVVFLAAGGGFFGGITYQKSRQPSFGNFNRQQGQGGNQVMGNGGFGTRGGNGQNRIGFRPVNGEITEINDKSMTVKLVDGGSKIVILSDKTSVNKAESATISDLKTGSKVAVFGQENADGSVTAQNIQLNPILREMPVTPTP